MNIIDAYKKAKMNQYMERTGPVYGRIRKVEPLKIFLAGISESDLLADDWEIVKTLKTSELTMKELRNQNGNSLISTHIPNDAKLVITWEE